MHGIRFGGVAALLLAAACADSGNPPTLPSDVGPPTAAAGQGNARAEEVRYERLARRVALALNDAEFRAAVYRDLRQSPFREQKVHLQAFLGRGSVNRARLAMLSGDADAGIDADLEGQRDIELYFPVPAHRTRWSGDTDLLVATALEDDDTPIAYDLRGRRRALNQRTPPETPVLAVVPAEQSFATGPAAITCLESCDDEVGGGGGGSAGGVLTPGLNMLATQFSGTFESWIKGSPEFEVHLMGQKGTTDSLQTVQCVGEKAGGPYEWDQNSEGWTGTVLVASTTQLAAYEAAHPGQGLRLMVLEDDDGACQIRTDVGRLERMIAYGDSAYRQLGGGKDVPDSFGKKWKAAKSAQKFLAALWSWLTSADDIVGMAIEDRGAANAVLFGANWIVKDDVGRTNGAIQFFLKNP